MNYVLDFWPYVYLTDKLITTDVVVPTTKPELEIMMSPFNLKQLSGGVTNIMYLLNHEQRNYILRIYGDGSDNDTQGIDRKREIDVTVALSNEGIGPKIYALFNNARIEEFYNGGVLADIEDVSEEHYREVMREIRKLHDKTAYIDIDNNTDEWDIVRCIKRYRDIIVKSQTIYSMFIDSYPNIVSDIDMCLQEADRLKDQFDMVGCHNDLHNFNIIVEHIDSKPIIKFIDFEYFGINPRYYDLTHYFNELCTTDCKYVILYPDFSRRKKFYEYYYLDTVLTDEEVEEIDKKVTFLSKLSHLFWGMWALIKHATKTDINFDYKKYFHARIGRFYHISRDTI